MDEDISVINTNIRNKKIKDFLIKNKNKITTLALVMIVVLLSFYSYDKYKANKKTKISNSFNSATSGYSKNTKDNTTIALLEIINKKDTTYSPLSLYFIIDNKLILDQIKINNLFDILIEKTPLDKEIKNLVIYKKALFNADQVQEAELLNIVNPLINSESVWKSHALYLMAEYFYSKDQKQKAKEFFNLIVGLENSNINIIQKAQERLNRDLSE